MKKETDSLKNPTITIDKSLNKYSNVVLFPEKVAKANEMMKTLGLPKIEQKKEKTSKIPNQAS